MAINRLDLSKELVRAKPNFFPEEGTDLEQAAMSHHSKRYHNSSLPNGNPASGAAGFVTNGALPVAGAPYFEPCIDDRGTLMNGAVGNFFGGTLATKDDVTAMTTTGSSPFTASSPRVYKGANVQFDAVFNKLGYHFPQERIITLWQDVVPTIQKTRPPEPLVMRLNTFDCTTYVHANVVPKAYELDDYQVRTPTDIIGQHIHLPKWDLVSADGSANGWNYEDGTLSPEAVVETIEAINKWQTTSTPVLTDVMGAAVKTSFSFPNPVFSTNNFTLTPANHPYFGGQWPGARSTIQRWFADPVVNVQGVDRGLGIIFTHDHYGPSTHQQIGLYGTVLIEPAGSKWVHNETGTPLHTRTGSLPGDDGGPTSWQAAILTNQDSRYSASWKVGTLDVESYREFFLEYSDFQHAYQPGVYVGANASGQQIAPYVTVQGAPLSPGLFLNTTALTGNPNSFRDAIQPGYRLQAPLVNGFPIDLWVFPPTCLGNVPRPCPEAITAADAGMYVVNYRNESLVARVFDPKRTDCPGGRTGCQANGSFKQGDLAFAMVSSVQRAIPELNSTLGKAPATFAGGGTSPFLPPINQLAALAGGDPFTPMIRAYDGDNVYVKVQAGGQEEEHTISLHGLKWMQAGSGFGVAKNSGWRNAQPGGISEQFSFRMPIFADNNQRGTQADYAYVTAAGYDGWATGVWGILRSYGNKQSNLFAMPTNDPSKSVKFVNGTAFNKVCPATAPVRNYDVTAVLAEDVLAVPRDGNGTSLVTITDPFPGTHMGRAPEAIDARGTAGGTLVYNSRTTDIPALPGGQAHKGPLHDPAGILYVNTDDLIPDASMVVNQPPCWTPVSGGKVKYNPWVHNCAVHLFGQNPSDLTNYPRIPNVPVPVEPIVIRAAAGDCINVTLRNKMLEQAVTNDANRYPLYETSGGSTAVFLDTGKGLWADTNNDGKGDTTWPKANVKFDRMPDLASANPLPAIVRLNPGTGAVGMTSVQNNLFAPSPHVGLHPALVEYDVTRSNGVYVGGNPGGDLIGPNQQTTYQWYAGNISAKPSSTSSTTRTFTLEATPIEFGGFNIMPAEPLKQPQHGLVGAGAVYPQGATWTVDPGTTTSATVTEPASGGQGPWVFRDFSLIAQKGVAMFYKDSSPVENIEGEGTFGVAEDSQDMGGITLNYGTEPMWFRFGLNPAGKNPAGQSVLSDVAAGDAYSNGLVGGGDPQTAVFTTPAGKPVRMHVLMPTGAGRGSTFDLHGHVWQRDPYVCQSADLGLQGKCDMGNGYAGSSGTGAVGAQRLAGTGTSGQWRYENPMGIGIGGIESWFPAEHYEVVLPSAGGPWKITGDYLFRDHMGQGNAAGLWGIVRVQ